VAAAFFIPLLISVFLNYALSPPVEQLEAWRVPRMFGAALVMLVNSALLAVGLVLVIAGLVGFGLQTWLIGRAARMNAPAAFVALLFWGMLWGAWRLPLAVPIMVAVMTGCDNLPALRGWGALLGA